MGAARTLLKPVAFLAGLHASRQTSGFMRAHRRTREVQDALLDKLVTLHRDTDFGRDHHFAGVRSYEDFRANVPLGSYQTLKPYVDRVLAGHTTALLPEGEAVLMFSMTSGTTGEPKYIPVTGRFAAQIRRGWNIYGLNVLGDHPNGWLRPIVQISSPMRETDSPTGLPCGAISGMMARHQKGVVRRMYVVPPDVRTLTDPVAKYYATLRCGLGRDVAIIVTANPSSTVRLIETGQHHAEQLIRDVADGTIRPPTGGRADVLDRLTFRPNRELADRMDEGVKRDGQLLPRHFWNLAFLCNWTGGTLRLYVRRLRELFGNVPIRDIGLLASEGRFSIPTADETPAGVAEITGNFLEFIPADERHSAEPVVLRAHELEIGGEYFLVFSNFSGLWRYNLDDRVRVVDRIGESPVFEFLCRGVQTANITGEKLTEHHVVEAMRRASAGAPPERFVVQPHFADTPYYELQVEAPDDPAADALAGRVDAELQAMNIEYAAKRESGRLGPVRATHLPDGTMDRRETEEIRRRDGRSEQYKHKYLLTDIVEDTIAAK